MMYLKTYKNELIIAFSLLLLLIAINYKHGKVSEQTSSSAGTSLQEIKEVIALKKIWGDKRITKKVDTLKTLVSVSKVKWNKESKKLTASFSNLTNQELNNLTVKIMNLAVEIQKFEVKNMGESYHVEFKCKW